MNKKKVGKALLFIGFIALYFNIGWGLNNYLDNNVLCHDFEKATIGAKLFGGHCFFLSSCTQQAKEKLENNFGFRVAVWPVIFLVSFVSWTIHIIYWVGPWTLKMIFAGGFVKFIFNIS